MINKRQTLRTVYTQGWTNSFLDAPSGTQKMVGQNRSVRPIETELEILLFFFIT